VVTTTTGEDPDPDGYTIQIDADAPQVIGPAARLEVTEVRPGNHSVVLVGLAPNCSVDGENPRTVPIVAGETATTEFQVTCSATTGSVVVTSSTSGLSIDLDGYTLIVDGVDRGPIPASGQVTVAGLIPGSHVTGLSGVDGNCQIQGDNLRTITVTAGASTGVDYVVSCVAPPPGAGTLRITTVTTGASADPNGFTYALDGDVLQPIGVNAVAELTNLTPGAHSVRLSGIAENCDLEGTNPRSATVPAGGSADVNFRISCAPAVGSIRVTASTSGASLDADGYLATLDGGAGQALGVDGSVRFSDVSVGSHTIALSNVAGNCTVAEGTTRTVTVTLGETSDVRFVVTCSQPQPASGSVRVTTTTGGEDPDPDGYTLFVDNSNRGDIGLNGELVISDLAAGDHTLELRGIASNCAVEGSNPRTVTVVAGQQTSSGFVVTCSAIPPTTGSIRVIASTSGEDQDPDGYQLSLDGSNAGPLGLNEERVITNVSAGQHTLELTGLAENCTVADNPRTVTVTAGQETSTTFAVTCTAIPPAAGSIRVQTSTDGEDQDPDGYQLLVDGAPAESMGNDDEAVISGLAPGDHNLELTGLAGNCTVGDNPRTVTVTAGQETTTSFAVTCTAIPPETGTIEIRTTTTGDNQDGAYIVQVDGGETRPVSDATPVTISSVPVGSHSITLSDVEGNCGVSPATTVNVDVAGGETEQLEFGVQCNAITPPPGSTGVTASR
jgi:hypothetical protein